MKTIKSGTVVYFSDKKGRLFGFIKPDEDKPKSVFFHVNAARLMYPGESSPQFLEDRRPERLPYVRDRVVYVPTWNIKGPKARRWAFMTEYNRVLSIIKNRPIFRVMMQTTTQSTNGSLKNELWRGTSWDFGSLQLQAAFNPVTNRYPVANNGLKVLRWWEESTDQGKTWSRIDCPTHYEAMFDENGVWIGRKG